MNKLLTTAGILILTYSQFSCVSVKTYQDLNKEKASLNTTIQRLRKQNDELTNEKFELASSLQSKAFIVQTTEQKFKEIEEASLQKIREFKQENEKLKENLKISDTERAKLQQDLSQREQDFNKEIDSLKEKLQWVYSNYNIKRRSR